jgi:hypothetical protein
VHLRRLESHETHLHRNLRLLALGAAPDSLGETVAEAAARPISYWEDLYEIADHHAGVRLSVPARPALAIAAGRC